MEIIPVIDLMHGQVVHARLGQRHLYQPIQSSLCTSSNPIVIVDALLELYPFRRLYIADIDAIKGLGNHLDTIRKIRMQYPNLDIWLDAGLSNLKELEIWETLKVTHVIGSENITAVNDLIAIIQQLEGQLVLSLDFNRSGFIGCMELETNHTLWPNKIIVMDLTLVGSEKGPALQRLQNIIKMSGDCKIFAAGGVKNNEDIEQLRSLNMSGALVATALHNGNLKPR